jgi:hypothetical protein
LWLCSSCPDLSFSPVYRLGLHAAKKGKKWLAKKLVQRKQNRAKLRQ